MRLIFQLYAREGLSLRATSRKLAELGIKAPGGGDWDNRTLREILSRETYIGTYYFRKRKAIEPRKPTRKLRRARKTGRTLRPREEWIPISVPPVVEKETFELAQRRLSGRRDRHYYYLRGLITCSACGRRFYGVSKGNRRYYTCSTKRRNKGNCRARNISAERIELFVWRERIQTEYEELVRKEEQLRAELTALERAENERQCLRASISSAIEYARELGRATDHLTPDERGEIMSTLLEEVVLEDLGDCWGVQLKGALPCFWGGQGHTSHPGSLDINGNRWGLSLGYVLS